MNTRKLSVAMAALLLGIQFGSPTLAALSERDIALVEAYVASGQVEELMALLAANPELLELAGALGEALRAFAAAPSPTALAALAVVANGQVAVAIKAAYAQTPGASIY